MAKQEDISVYEILVNIWRFSEHVYHSPHGKCHCSFHLKECIIEAKINWNEKDWDDFATAITKIIDHDPQFKEVCESVIKFEKNIASIYDLIEK